MSFRSNLKQAQIYGFAYGFSQCVVFAMYGGAFRFGAWQVSLGEMAPENVYKSVDNIDFSIVIAYCLTGNQRKRQKSHFFSSLKGLLIYVYMFQ